jgi:hypothetical protein
MWDLVTKKNDYVHPSIMVFCLSEGLNMEDPEFKDIKDNKPALVEAIERRFQGHMDDFEFRYQQFLISCLNLPIGLAPFKNYKMQGRRMLDVDGFLDDWAAHSVACVTTERSLMQRVDQMETEFLVGMRARCVIECSTDDKIWAFKYPGGDEKMAFFDNTPEGVEFKFGIMEQAVREQDEFINALNQATPEEAANIVLDPSLPHKLGLSIRLLQALYTKEVVLHDDRFLRSRMGSVGLTWDTTPLPFEVKPLSGRSIFDLACSIGIDSSI